MDEKYWYLKNRVALLEEVKSIKNILKQVKLTYGEEKVLGKALGLAWGGMGHGLGPDWEKV